MSKRKFSKKEVAISIAAAALAIATVGGAVAIHKDSSNSNTGHSITVEQSDYTKIMNYFHTTHFKIIRKMQNHYSVFHKKLKVR